MALRSLAPITAFEDLGNLNMWREDIIEVVDIFLEAIPGDRSAVIEIDNYQLDEIRDINQIPELFLIRIRVRDDTSKIALTLSRHESYVESIDPDLKIRGMITEIQKVASKYRRSKIVQVIASYWFWTALTASILGIALIAAAMQPGPLSNFFEIKWQGLVVGVGIGLLLNFYIKIMRAKQSILRSRSRVEAPTFWMRKKDDLAITLVSNGFSLILGGAIGYWINMLTK